MSTNRSLAAAAASTLLAAALLLGGGLPAQAGPPAPAPIIPGPSVTPVPSGTTVPLILIPPCATMASARSITTTRATSPGFGPIANVAGAYGARNATLVSVLTARTGARTCTFGVGTTPQVIMTETAITAAQYRIIKTWYDSNASSSRPGGGPVLGGARIDTHYFVGTSEVASISPNGWWITVRDIGAVGALPYFEMDAVRQFFDYNPPLALISR